MQVISSCADLKSEWYAVLGQSCMKTGVLCLFVVMFLPVVSARTGANEQNVAWLPILLSVGLVLFNFHTHKKKKQPKTKQTQTCNRNRDESYNLQAKNNLQTIRNTTYLLLT